MTVLFIDWPGRLRYCWTWHAIVQLFMHFDAIKSRCGSGFCYSHQSGQIKKLCFIIYLQSDCVACNGGAERVDFRIFTALRCALTWCLWVSMSCVGWNGRCKWIPISLSHCDLTKAETTMLPPSKALYQIPSWAEQRCTAKESYLPGGWQEGRPCEQVAFLTWVPSSQWSLTTCLAWLFTRDWQKEKNQSLCSQPDLEASLLIWIQWSWSVWPWENPQEEIESQWESLGENLKCIGNESCWVLALRKPRCGFAFCLSASLRGWWESRNSSLFSLSSVEVCLL